MFDIFSAKDPQKALQKANEYIKDGRVGSAIKVLENNLTGGDDSFDLYLNLARLYFGIEERGRAVEILRQAKSIVPSKTNEIVTLLSELYYQHASIDSADFLMQLNIEQQGYGEINKVLRQLSDREIKLLLTRYDKLKQSIDNKKVVSKKDFENVLILTSLRFFVDESEKASEVIESMIGIDITSKKLLRWAEVIARERYNDWHAGLLLMRIQMVNQNFEGAITIAQRISEKFAESIDSLIAIISLAKPPEDLETTYTKFLTDLYIKKGDPDASIDLLTSLLEKDAKKVDDVIKGLRELERINPKDLKILYALGDTYVKANRISLAIGEFDKILEIDQAQYEKVIQKYKDAFNVEPNNPHVIDGLVKAYLSQNEIDSAVDIIDAAYKSDPGLLDEYIINLNTILEKNLNNARALYFLGLCYAHKGDHENALVILENLLANEEFKYVYNATKEICKEKPDDLQYLNLRAKSMIMLGEEKNALSLLNDYLKQAPDKTAALLPALDMIISKHPKLSKIIIPIYEQFRKKDPFVAELTLARAYAFTGEYEKSVNIFERLFTDEEHKDVTKRALIEVIREKSKAVPLLLAAARIFMREGEVEIATQFFKTAQMVDPKAFFEIVDEFYDTLKTFPKDREIRTLLVDTFYDRKLWDRVIEESKRAIDVFGREAQYFNLKLGQSLVEKGNLSDAVRPLMLSLDGAEDYSEVVIESLDKIININKSNVPAHFARGRALSKARRINEAVKEYLLTVRILPARAEYVYEELKTLSSKAMANPPIIFAMGSVEIILEKYEDAIKHLLQSCELDVTLVKRVIPLFEKLINVASSPLLEFAMAKVYHLANLGSLAVKYYIKAQADERTYREPAIYEMKKICAENPGDVESRKGLAEIYFNYNDLEDSLDLVNDVYNSNTKENKWVKNFISSILYKDQQHIPSYYLLADVFLNEKEHKKAAEIYKKLIEISPTETTKVINILDDFKDKSGDILLCLANFHKDVGDISKAIKLFDELFAIDTSFAEAIIYQIKEILKKNAKMAEAYLLAIKIFVFQKEYERAVEAIKHVRELMPDNEEIILKEGHIYYEMGEVEKAIKLYTELLGKTKNRKAIYRLIKKTRKQYFNEKIGMIKGDEDKDRLERANIYLLMNKLSMTGKELQFTPQNNFSIKQHTLLKAKLYLKRNRPLNALEMMKTLPVDEETACVYADIYETMGSYEAAAMVLRQIDIEGMAQRIASDEKLAQDRRLAKGRYFIEGRS
jgi:tetratricopeptide (TPR) repeat protein